MKNLSALCLFLSALFFAQENFPTPFEKGNGNQTTTYTEMLRFYTELDDKYETVSTKSFGTDDNGEPIKVVIFSPDKNEEHPTILINNGIHPGEPDGIDATMMLLRDLATGKISAGKLKIAAIQTYNISGMLRRGKFSRANQNGPEEYGFRGNARNYDLNRDFIKADTENAKTFQQIFHYFKPVFFIDNHVSNGADYQYLFTYISTNRERLGPVLGNYFHQKMQPEILQTLEKEKILTTPYVNIHGDSPDAGFAAFMDTPRYATGYTALFGTPGTVAETHMLKPYRERVRATYAYMLSSIQYTQNHLAEIQKIKRENLSAYRPGMKYTLQWELDSARYKTLDFKGFEAGQKLSEVTGRPRLFYDRSKPFSRPVRFFDTYISKKDIVIPRYYVVPQAQREVLTHLRRNGIRMKTLQQDSVISVERYRISDFQTVKDPYEGHYLHYSTVATKENLRLKLSKGDFLIPAQQDGVKYLLETLEPEAVDSFFNWNFFDAILGQKEYFSAYVFEDTAAQLLQSDQVLKTAFEAAKIADPDMAADAYRQLDWIYRHSPYYEGTVGMYPIYRIP